MINSVPGRKFEDKSQEGELNSYVSTEYGQLHKLGSRPRASLNPTVESILLVPEQHHVPHRTWMPRPRDELMAAGDSVSIESRA